MTAEGPKRSSPRHLPFCPAGQVAPSAKGWTANRLGGRAASRSAALPRGVEAAMGGAVCTGPAVSHASSWTVKREVRTTFTCHKILLFPTF